MAPNKKAYGPRPPLLKQPGYAYTNKVKILESLLQAQAVKVLACQQQLDTHKHRELLLLDLVMHQEQILFMYSQYQLGGLACLSLEDQPSAPGAAAAMLSHIVNDATADCNGSCQHSADQHQDVQLQGQLPYSLLEQDPQQQRLSYVAGLLQQSTPAQWQQVSNMTSDDWSKYFIESFQKLPLLLELADRVGETGHGHPVGRPTAVSAAAVQDSPAGSSSQLPHVGTVSASSPTTALQQLEAIVDEWVTLSALGLIINPMAVYVATTRNHATQQPSPPPPPSHWLRVVRRMNLTMHQAAHFALALAEICRLDEGVKAAGGPLARRAGCPSVQVLAAAAAAATTSAPAATPTAAEDEGGDSSCDVRSSSCSSSSSGDMISATAAAAARERSIASLSRTVAAFIEPTDEQDATEEALHASGDSSGDSDVLLKTSMESKLQRNVGRLPLHAQLLIATTSNILSKVQLATCLVASFPYIPLSGPIASAAAHLYQQQLSEQQRLQQTILETSQAEIQTAMQEAAAACDEFRHLSCSTGDNLGEKRSIHQLQQQQQWMRLQQQVEDWWEEWGLAVGSLQDAVAEQGEQQQQQQQLDQDVDGT